MARPTKAIVDYFPHDCNYGKTIPILQQKFGIIGYAVWFKILEQLGKSENHYIDCRDDEIWLFLVSEIMIEEDLLRRILGICARLGAIDKELWEQNIIFSENYTERIKDAYRKRKETFLTKEDLYRKLFPKNESEIISGGINPQSKEKEKVKEIIKEKFAEFVSMTAAEHSILITRFGESVTNKAIEILDNYKGSNGKKYKSDYRAILNWVIDRVKEKNISNPDRGGLF